MARLGDIFTITSGGTPDKKKSEYYFDKIDIHEEYEKQLIINLSKNM